jgi:uncharacterized protein (DUF58 family)
VNEAHPERNSDVVVFLDTFAEARRADTGTLDLGVRAAAALAAHYLKEKDRVGLVSFGGVLNWLTASGGPTQLYRIVDSLLDAEIALSYAWNDLDVLPPARCRRVRSCRVVRCSTARGRRAIDLRARGFDLAARGVSFRSSRPDRDRSAGVPALAPPAERGCARVRGAGLRSRVARGGR